MTKNMQDNSRILTWVFIFAALASAAAVIIAALIISNSKLRPPPVATEVTPNISVYQAQVDADKLWQDTDIMIRIGDQVTIQYISGTWKGGIGTGQWYGGQGDLVTKYRCADEVPDPSICNEPMPNVYNGTLIGKIGDNLVEIGDYLQFTSDRTGNLFLRMNDHDEGLFDNQGSITVRISVQQPK